MLKFRETTSPRSTAKSTFFRTCNSPYDLQIFSASIIIILKDTQKFFGLLNNLLKFAVPKTEGEVVEWSITAVLKTVELKGSGGSNPSLSAKIDYQGVSIAKAMLISFSGGPDESSLSEGVGRKRNSGLLAA